MSWYKSPIRPYDPVIEYDPPSQPLRYFRSEFNGAGLYSYPQPPNEPQDQFSELTNIMPPLNGSFVKRWGSIVSSAFTHSDVWIAERGAVYANQSYFAPYKRSVWMGTADGVPIIRVFDDATVHFADITPPASSTHIYMANSRSYAYFTDGFDSGFKWAGNAIAGNGPITNIGIAAPLTPITIQSVASAGSVTLVSGRTYFLVYRDSVTTHMSDLSPVSVPVSTGAITNKQISLTALAVSPDAQVDTKWILATADGGDQTLLYFVAEVTNATTTYTDDTPELTLLANNIVQETDINGNEIGVAGNDLPVTAGKLIVKHQGRLFISRGAQLFCSKNLQELTTSTGLVAGRYEESWPPENSFDISNSAESITSLFSDGITLYIGTPQHIYRLNGDSPADFQFQQVAFNEAGVVSQDAISVVYDNGQPSGAIWMTPDRRLIHSDFNTYSEIGGPIQDLLNQIPEANLPYVRVTFYSFKEYDLCTVQFSINPGVTNSNTVWAVFDMKAGTWVKWTFPVGTLASLLYFTVLGTPLWYYFDATSSHELQQLVSTATDDNGTIISAAISTPYYHFGTPTERKCLNELEVVTNDVSTKVTILAATTAADFLGPDTLASNQSLTVSPLGDYKIFPAATDGGGHHRYFKTRLTTSAALSSTTNWIESLNYEVIPIHKL